MPDAEKPFLGECLRIWRKRENLSQESAARMLGVAATTWSHWETGRRIPTPRLLYLLRDMTGFSIGLMMCENSQCCRHARRILYPE